jgi:hypothetical protein
MSNLERETRETVCGGYSTPAVEPVREVLAGSAHRAPQATRARPMTHPELGEPDSGRTVPEQTRSHP